MQTMSAQAGDGTTELLTVGEVLDHYKLSRSSLYRIVAAGLLEPVYLDSRPRFDVRDVQRLIEERRGRPKK